jgi:HEAT repeat protein
LGFYDLSKENRIQLIAEMEIRIVKGLELQDTLALFVYAADKDTYIRKQAYTILGKLYQQKAPFRLRILETVKDMLTNDDEKVRQTAVYALGEFGDLEKIARMLERGMNDPHPAVRNAVIGALKQLGHKYPSDTLVFARQHLHDANPEIRRQIIHGIELHGRTHPQDVLPLLRGMQDETERRVRDMIVHVLGQISYKNGCLETVIRELKTWQNRTLVKKAIVAILKVHAEQDYPVYSMADAAAYIQSEIDDIEISLL